MPAIYLDKTELVVIHRKSSFNIDKLWSIKRVTLRLLGCFVGITVKKKKNL